MNKLTVSRSRHILASIINKHARRREVLYDIIQQERLDEDLEKLEVAIMHTDDDDNPIPITFDLTLMLLAHHIANTYSRVDKEPFHTDSRPTKSLGDRAPVWNLVHPHTMNRQWSGHMEQKKTIRYSRHPTG